MWWQGFGKTRTFITEIQNDTIVLENSLAVHHNVKNIIII